MPARNSGVILTGRSSGGDSNNRGSRVLNTPVESSGLTDVTQRRIVNARRLSGGGSQSIAAGFVMGGSSQLRRSQIRTDISVALFHFRVYLTSKKGKCKATNEAVIRKYIGFKGSGQGAPYHVIREATILKGLHHPNIIRLFDVIHELYSVEFIYECLPRDLRTILDEKISTDYEDGSVCKK